MPETSTRQSTARRPASSSSSSGRRRAATTISPTAVLDLVERLGLVDMVIDRVKQRLDDVDIDNILDEAGRYLKRNPDVLVVCLGAATVAAGAVVFMHKQRNGDSENGNGRARTSGAHSR